MSERDAFIRNIIDQPEDDTVRLVFADWLDEQGESSQAMYIRRAIMEPGVVLIFDSEPVWSVLPDGIIPEWSRGFVAKITCSAADWLAHADALLAAHPVTRVTLTTWPDEDCHSSDMFTTNRYRLTARNEGQSRVFRPARPNPPRLPQPCTRERIAALLADEWPRIAFTLPASAPGRRTVFSPA